MAKLNLVIADTDESYIRGLSEFINSNHSSSFRVSCFTRFDFFKEYMEQQSSTDILAACPDFCDAVTEACSIRLKLLLLPGALDREYPGFHIINKYTTGEKLVSEMLYMYSKSSPSEQSLLPYSKDTLLVAVYSASGGAGKTTIAASLSIQCAESGKKCFYLNLESFQSTEAFFGSGNKRGLSYGFFYIKERSRNLSFKLNGLKSSDSDYGVQYFSPPESPMEYEEISADDLEQLIKGIRDQEPYDYIFIDMSSNFDMKNYRIMELCDKIVLVNLQETVTMHKSSLLYNELVRLGDTDKSCITDKFINVINRYKHKESVSICGFAEIAANAVQVPEYSRVLIKADGRLTVDDEDYRKAINRLIKEISG